MPFFLLGIAISFELVATSLLKETDGFSKPLPTAACLVGYGISFLCLAQVVTTLPIGMVYALWSGIGTAAVVAIGVTFFGEHLTGVKIAGIVLIVIGAIILNLGGSH